MTARSEQNADHGPGILNPAPANPTGGAMKISELITVLEQARLFTGEDCEVYMKCEHDPFIPSHVEDIEVTLYSATVVLL